MVFTFTPGSEAFSAIPPISGPGYTTPFPFPYSSQPRFRPGAWLSTPSRQASLQHSLNFVMRVSKPAATDSLTGGTGDDLLSGGASYDTYIYASGDGWDWIDDSDGQGQIMYDGMALTGGRRIADNVWQSADGKYTYSLFDHAENGTTDKALYIDGPDGGMLVKHWQNTQLGITLDDTATSPAADIVGTDDNDRLIGTANQSLDGGSGSTLLSDAGDDASLPDAANDCNYKSLFERRTA